MLTLSLAVEGEGLPKQSREESAQEENTRFSLGLVMSWNGIFLAKVLAEPSLLTERRSRLPKNIFKTTIV